jgi:hypothetical protein
MSSLNSQGVDECGTGRPRTPRVSAPSDSDPWDGFADWKLFDKLAWEVMKKVVKRVFDVETAGRLDLV